MEHIKFLVFEQFFSFKQSNNTLGNSKHHYCDLKTTSLILEPTCAILQSQYDAITKVINNTTFAGFCHVNAYSSSMSGSEEVAIELGIRISRIMGDKGKLGIRRTGSGQRDSTHGVSHEERLMRCITEFNHMTYTKRNVRNPETILPFHLHHKL